jgi:pyruvate dehydrogenase E2 component (dihydrolipoamide acetyltransferase)
MVEEVIKFKRVDGVGPALEKLRDGLMPGGQQGTQLKGGLTALAVPIQVIWGKDDHILPVSHADGLPDAVKLTLYEKTGHMPHMEKANEVNALIGGFVG